MSSDGKGFLTLGITLLVLAPMSLVLALSSLLPIEFALVGLIFLLLGGVFAGTGSYLRARVRREAEIGEEGIEGKAKLINWWIIGKSGGELSAVEYCKFELEVMVEGKPAYKVEHRQLVPFGVYSHLSKGMVLPVKVHREKPGKVLLDWDREIGQVSGGISLPVDIEKVMKGLIPKEEKGQLKERLRELEEAYNDRLISKEEYESKRTEILKNV